MLWRSATWTGKGGISRPRAMRSRTRRDCGTGTAELASWYSPGLVIMAWFSCRWIRVAPEVIRCRQCSGRLDDVDDFLEEVRAEESADEVFDDRWLDLFEDQRLTIPGQVALDERSIVVAPSELGLYKKSTIQSFSMMYFQANRISSGVSKRTATSGAPPLGSSTARICCSMPWCPAQPSRRFRVRAYLRARSFRASVAMMIDTATAARPM